MVFSSAQGAPERTRAVFPNARVAAGRASAAFTGAQVAPAPAQRFIEFLRVFSSQVAPAPRLREPPTPQTLPTACRNERGFLYIYIYIYIYAVKLVMKKSYGII